MPVWTSSLKIGVDQVDAQHEHLFEKANRFKAAVQAHEPYDRLEELFAFLSEYVLEHFEAEERIMRERGYPRLAEHMQEHVQFRRRLSSLVPQWNAEGESQAVLTALMGFLDGWLTQHVSGSDQEIGTFLRGRGA
jgi:hemerythrin-like metal-binding protein